MPEEETPQQNLIPTGIDDLIGHHSTNNRLSTRKTKDIFRKAFAEDSITLSDLFAYRCMVAWRFNRFVLNHQNRNSQIIFELPPEDYFDPQIEDYVQYADKIIQHLAIMRGPRLDPKSGWYGIFGMVDPQTAPLIYPTQDQVADLEVSLVEYCTTELARVSQGELKKHLQYKYGLHRYEQSVLISFAIDNALSRLEVDEDQEKALILLNLEDIANRARKLNDVRAELAVQKTKAQITGLTRAPKQKTELEDIEETIRLVSKNPKQIIPPSAAKES
jgi:hypothetical protein|tara:strand:+ start:442 stop:1266 length:825 start_codon:yes stop_codon:yes gene_type:complete